MNLNIAKQDTSTITGGMNYSHLFWFYTALLASKGTQYKWDLLLINKTKHELLKIIKMKL